VKKISLSIAVGAVLAIASVTASVAAELPTYEKTGLPISAVQVQVLGAANVQQSSPVITSVSPHQRSVLTPRGKVSTVAAAPGRSETVGRAVR
jgi:hypothetical protein